VYTNFHQKNCEWYLTLTLYSLCQKCGSMTNPIHMIGLENNLPPLKKKYAQSLRSQIHVDLDFERTCMITLIVNYFL